MEKLKRAVIKEEYVALTGDTMEALILNQFIYWSERVKDFDKFIQEENERILTYSTHDEDIKTIPLRYGWIYKKAIEIKDEIMSTDSEKTINRHLTSLVDKEFIERRNNPHLKYDRTYQYRVNFPKIIECLDAKGYTLQDYKVNISPKPLVSLNRQNDACKSQNDACKSQNDACKSQNDGAIPEITLETTLDITTHIQEKKVKALCVDVEKVLSEKISQKKIQELINSKGADAVNQYLSNWDKYRHHANSTQSAYFIYCVSNELPVPQSKKSTYTTAKPTHENFDQREYEEGELENFYVDVTQ